MQMNTAGWRRIVVAAALGLAVTSSAAADAGAPEVRLLGATNAPPAIARVGSLPAEQRAGEIAYTTGGIGAGQAALFRRARSRYPLSIELWQRAGKRNQSTADARVEVADLSGRTVFEADARGPYMLVRLPDGKYRVRATLKGHSEAAITLAVGGRRHASAVFIFPQSVVTSEAVPQPAKR